MHRVRTQGQDGEDNLYDHCNPAYHPQEHLHPFTVSFQEDVGGGVSIFLSNLAFYSLSAKRGGAAHAMSLVSIRKKGSLYKLPVKGIVKVGSIFSVSVAVVHSLHSTEMEQALVRSALHHHRRRGASRVL